MKVDVDRQIALWRNALREEGRLPEEDLQELEDHLRDGFDSLKALGLADDEALLVAMKRMGEGHLLAQEMARVDEDKVWAYFFDRGTPDRADAAGGAGAGGMAGSRTAAGGALPGGVRARGATARGEIAWVLGAALLAAVLGKVPLGLGVPMAGRGLDVYALNLAVFVVPVLAAGYYLKNRFSTAIAGFIAVAILSSAIAANLYPFAAGGSTLLLVTLHLPLFLWIVFGLAYAGDDWRSVRGPLDFIRFSGELFLYGVLILCGTAVLVVLFVFFFDAAGVPVYDFAQNWLGFSLLLATPVIAAYLVEKKRSLIENLAPVLARIFIPLFLLMMLGFIGAVAVRGYSAIAGRDILIATDLLLVLIVGMVLYDLSARRTDESFSLPHAVNLALIVAALVIDCIALYGIAQRLAAWGFSPNKTAALGENLLLLGNLFGLAVIHIRFALGRSTLAGVLAWQVRYLPVYFVWMAFVVFGLPVVFGFR